MLLLRKPGTGDTYSSLVDVFPSCGLLAWGVVAEGWAILGGPPDGVAIFGVNGAPRPTMPFATEGPCRGLWLGPFSGAIVAVKVLVERVMPPSRALLSRLKRGERSDVVRLGASGLLLFGVEGAVEAAVEGSRDERLGLSAVFGVVDLGGRDRRVVGNVVVVARTGLWGRPTDADGVIERRERPLATTEAVGRGLQVARELLGSAVREEVDVPDDLDEGRGGFFFPWGGDVAMMTGTRVVAEGARFGVGVWEELSDRIA